MGMNRSVWAGLLASLVIGMAMVAPASAQQPKPNILVIMADDIGYWNISAYNRGMMGYRTPNIDRIANEGAIFTDYYGQQSCTAGRAAFITGQSPMRTGLLKVGLPGAKEGLSDKDPTLAELLKPLDTRLGNSARTISATATSSCPRFTASTSSSAIFTTSMPRTSPSTPNILRRPSSNSSSVPVACLDARRPLSRRPGKPPSANGASRTARTPASSTRNAWKRWTRSS